MNRSLKITFVIIALILAVMVSTNPSYKDFEHFTATTHLYSENEGFEYHKDDVRIQIANYWIYSKYIIQTYELSGNLLDIKPQLKYTHEYIGFLSNIYYIK